MYRYKQLHIDNLTSYRVYVHASCIAYYMPICSLEVLLSKIMLHRQKNNRTVIHTASYHPILKIRLILEVITAWFSEVSRQP